MILEEEDNESVSNGQTTKRTISQMKKVSSESRKQEK